MGRSFNSSLLLLSGWVLLTGGCAGPANPSGPPPASHATPAPPAPPIQSAADKRFIIAPELAGILHVVNVRLDKPPGSYLKIQVTVENMTSMRQQISYRIEWFDQEGVKLQQDSQGFTPWMLLPREVASIAMTAPMPMAADFGIAFVPAPQ